MELAETIAASLAQELAAKCPFEEDAPDAPEKQAESCGDDDKDSVQAQQANDGGVLGANLLEGKAGVADGGPFPPTDFLYRQPANDTNRGRKTRLRMKAYKLAQEGDFPLTVAAHHLIPGNAALKRVAKLSSFMEKGGTVEATNKKKYTIKSHIGYDVNGSHNGVWLPGNYAIKTELPEREMNGTIRPAREGTTPIAGVSWSALKSDYDAWQFAYVAGACKAGGGQFHDTHENPYSASVRAVLGKIEAALSLHLEICEDCKNKKPEIPPPFRIKRRLYSLSSKLRQYVTGYPSSWKRPWCTSERWVERYFSGGKLTNEFRRAYAEAVETRQQTGLGDVVGI
jgi:hypothetical protein